MIYSLEGKLIEKRKDFIVLEINGVAFKLFTHSRLIDFLPSVSTKIKLFTYLYVRDNIIELYGFENEEELKFFELLNSISGVGPKSALAILEISQPNDLAAAIKESRLDLLTRASGIGKKTAERIILELKNKIEFKESEARIKKIESDADLVEILVNLGYSSKQARAVLLKIDNKIVKLEDRLKEALKILKEKNNLS